MVETLLLIAEPFFCQDWIYNQVILCFICINVTFLSKQAICFVSELLGSEGYLAGLSLSVVRNPVRFDPGKQQRRRDS